MVGSYASGLQLFSYTGRVLPVWRFSLKPYYEPLPSQCTAPATHDRPPQACPASRSCLPWQPFVDPLLNAYACRSIFYRREDLSESTADGKAVRAQAERRDARHCLGAVDDQIVVGRLAAR